MQKHVYIQFSSNTYLRNSMKR